MQVSSTDVLLVAVNFGETGKGSPAKALSTIHNNPDIFQGAEFTLSELQSKRRLSLKERQRRARIKRVPLSQIPTTYSRTTVRKELEILQAAEILEVAGKRDRQNLYRVTEKGKQLFSNSEQVHAVADIPELEQYDVYGKDSEDREHKLETLRQKVDDIVYGIGRKGRNIHPTKATQTKDTQFLLEQRESVRPLNIKQGVLAIVVVDDDTRLAHLGETVKMRNKAGLKVTGVDAEKLIFTERTSDIVYVSSIKDAVAEMEKRERRTWDNTFFFIETNIAENEEAAYNDLREKRFVWKLHIPPRSLCSVTPLGFLTFSLKFNDILTRIQNKAADEEIDRELRVLAEIILRNIGEEITTTNIDHVIATRLNPIVAGVRSLTNFDEPQTFLKVYSGRFIWNLPAIEPKDWNEVDDYFDTLKEVYSAA
jgi:hypothetical protein